MKTNKKIIKSFVETVDSVYVFLRKTFIFYGTDDTEWEYETQEYKTPNWG